MTKQEREAVTTFMYAVLQQTFPEWREYPLEHMALVEDTQGEGFEGTAYEGTNYLIRAYYAVKAWKIMLTTLNS